MKNPKLFFTSVLMATILASSCVTAFAEEEQKEKEKETKAGSWVDITSTKQFTVHENCTVTVRASDAAGNITEKVIIIDKIDGELPQLSTVVQDDGKHIQVTASDSPSGIQKVIVGNKAYTSGSFIHTIPDDYDWSAPLTITAYDKANNASDTIVFDREIPPKYQLEVPENSGEYVPSYPYTFDLDVGITNPDDVGKVEVSANGEGFQDYTSNFKANAPYIKDFVIKNECDITIKVTDAWGRESEITFPSGKLDDISPILTAIPTDDGKQLEVSASDEGSGVAKVTVNGQEFAEESFTYDIPAGYDWSIPLTLTAYDKANNQSNVIQFDREIPPVSQPDVSTDNGDFVNQYPANIDILIDSANPNDVAKVEIQVDCDGWVDYTGNYQANAPYVKDFVVERECEITVKVTDVWGRESEDSTSAGVLDDTKPTVDYIISDDKTNITITGKDEDSSGVDKIIVNGQEYTDNPLSYPISKEEDIVIQVVDKAGNVSDEVVIDYDTMLDPSAPSIEVTLPSRWILAGTETQIPVTAEDNVGVVKLEYKIGEGEEWQDITGVNEFIVSSNCTAYLRATDAAGNVGVKQVEIAFFDNGTPTVQTDISPKGEFVLITAHDSKSGIQSITINGTEYLGDTFIYLFAAPTDLNITAKNNIGLDSDNVSLDYDKDILPPSNPGGGSDENGNGSNSSGSSVGKYAKGHDAWNRSSDFWEKVNRDILKSERDAVLKISAKGHIQMPRSTMETLHKRSDVTLDITWFGGKFIIPSGCAAPVESNRIFYTLPNLTEHFMTAEKGE